MSARQDPETRRILDEFHRCAADVDRSLEELEAQVIQIGCLRRSLDRSGRLLHRDLNNREN